MQATIYDLDGDEAGTLELPAVFATEYRPDLIARAVRAAQANRTQAYGADPHAGMRTTAESLGTGRGMARVPRANNRGARVPQAVGGRRSHPPKAEADRGIDLNDKERKLATRSAIAATADAERVADRGHAFDEERAFPLVVGDAFASLQKTQAALATFAALGIDADVERAEAGTKIRAGRGKTRGRKKRTPRSVCVVTSSEAGPSRAARNLAGVDVATAAEVNVEDLAPGGAPGRLTVWTESAIAEVADR